MSTKFSNLDLNSPKTRQGMNRLWMVLTGVMSLMVATVVGMQDSEEFFPALLITGLSVYFAGLTLYWLTHWIMQGFRTLPSTPPPKRPPPNPSSSTKSSPPNPPSSSPSSSQSSQSKQDRTRIDRFTFLKHVLLVYFGLPIAAVVFFAFIASVIPDKSAPAATEFFMVLWIVAAIFQFIYSLNRIILRLHDLDRSGGWCLLMFVPLVNLIFLIALCCIQGTPGENKYGTLQYRTADSRQSAKKAIENSGWAGFVVLMLSAILLVAIIVAVREYTADKPIATRPDTSTSLNISTGRSRPDNVDPDILSARRRLANVDLAVSMVSDPDAKILIRSSVLSREIPYAKLPDFIQHLRAIQSKYPYWNNIRQVRHAIDRQVN